MRLVQLWKKLTSEKSGMPILPAERPEALEVFESLSFSDMWQEADMSDVCHYLRGGKGLQIPVAFASSVPRKF